MTDDQLLANEARREAQHGMVKARVERHVNAEIAARADQTTKAEALRIDQVAGEVRGNAIDEVVTTERQVETARGTARISQVFDFAFFLIYTLLGVRLVLALVAARPDAGFVKFIHTVTAPLYAPFRGIVASPSAEGGYTLALPIVVAMIVYGLLHVGINRLLRVIALRKTEI